MNHQWLQRLSNAIAECAGEAVKLMKPSVFKYKTSICEIGINRIESDCEEKALRTDQEVGVLEIMGANEEKISAVLVNYACHPVTMSCQFQQYSKDYPHYMVEMLKTHYGVDTGIVFTSGCCGDINPLERESHEKLVKNGSRLAESVIAAKEAAYDIKSAHSLFSIRSVRFNVPLNPEFNVDTIADKQEEP